MVRSALVYIRVLLSSLARSRSGLLLLVIGVGIGAGMVLVFFGIGKGRGRLDGFNIDHAKSAVVLIQVPGRSSSDPVRFCSGCFLSRDGLVLTAGALSDYATTCTVGGYSNGELFAVDYEIKKTSEDGSLCLLGPLAQPPNDIGYLTVGTKSPELLMPVIVANYIHLSGDNIPRSIEVWAKFLILQFTPSTIARILGHRTFLIPQPVPYGGVGSPILDSSGHLIGVVIYGLVSAEEKVSVATTVDRRQIDELREFRNR